MQCPDYKVFKIKNITEMIFDNHQYIPVAYVTMQRIICS